MKFLCRVRYVNLMNFFFSSILLHSDNVYMDFSGQDNPVFKGSKQGRIYLTSHRMIFNNKKVGDHLQSFSAPFIAMKDVNSPGVFLKKVRFTPLFFSWFRLNLSNRFLEPIILKAKYELNQMVTLWAK